MKRLLLVFLLFFVLQLNCIGNTQLEMITDGNIVVYTPSNETWSTGGNVEDGFVLTKKVQYGAGAYSQYFYNDNKLAITLTSDCELIKDGKLISVNNNELKYTKLVYIDDNFIEENMSTEELQNVFPDTEIVMMSSFKQNKYWTTKELFKKRMLLLVNDTKKFYYNPTCILPKAQTSEIKGLITLYKFGKYYFNHFGEHKGHFCIYVK